MKTTGYLRSDHTKYLLYAVEVHCSCVFYFIYGNSRDSAYSTFFLQELEVGCKRLIELDQDRIQGVAVSG